MQLAVAFSLHQQDFEMLVRCGGPTSGFVGQDYPESRLLLRVDWHRILTHQGMHPQALRRYPALRTSSLGAVSSQPRGLSTLRRDSGQQFGPALHVDIGGKTKLWLRYLNASPQLTRRLLTGPEKSNLRRKKVRERLKYGMTHPMRALSTIVQH